METDHRSKLVRESLEAAKKAREWILKFTTFQIDQKEFIQGLGVIKARETITSNWDLFKSKQELYPCLEIYQIIDSLYEDLEHQLKFYGYDSLKEDVRQLDMSIDMVKRSLGMDIFGKEKYYQFIQKQKQINGGI